MVGFSFRSGFRPTTDREGPRGEEPGCQGRAERAGGLALTAGRPSGRSFPAEDGTDREESEEARPRPNDIGMEECPVTETCRSPAEPLRDDRRDPSPPLARRPIERLADRESGRRMEPVLLGERTSRLERPG